MSSKDTHLYNPKPSNLSNGRPISTSHSLAFTSQLSSLISQSSSSSSRKPTPTSSRLKPKKSDLFARPNRNSAKRARRDDEDSPHFAQKHTTHGEGLERRVWERSQRKMEEKARLYAAMKRGDVEDDGEKYGVDFDRKWAEAVDQGGDEAVDDDDDDDDGEEDGGQVEYTDEFGRTRTGTRSEALRAQRSAQSRTAAEVPSDRFTTRPSAPAHVIYGDTIQHEAFDPEAPVAAQMEALARKRDKSLTPPPEEHFDGKKEVRSKGTGFFQFSEDGEERKRQMAELERERIETERVREARKQKLEERKRLVEERRREIQGKRVKRKADDFLEELGAEWGKKEVGSGDTTDGMGSEKPVDRGGGS